MANEQHASYQEHPGDSVDAQSLRVSGLDVYTAGILNAIQAGNIVFAKEVDAPFGPRDTYSHFSKGTGRNESEGGITEYNSRPLGAVVKDIISMQAALAQVVLLESGCGMAVAAYEASELGKGHPHGVVVDCLGLTPVNPCLQIDDAMNLLSSPNTPASIAPTRCDPFVRMQYIGSFPDDFEGDCKLPKNEYTLINDNRGPCTHTNDYRGVAQVLKEYLHMLREDGILMISDSTAACGFVGFNSSPGDVRFKFTPETGSTQKHYAILARAESVLAKAARSTYSKYSIDGVMYVDTAGIREIIASALVSPHS